MGKTLLFKDEDFSIWRQDGVPQDALEFLDKIAWGSEGAVYEHKNTAEHAKHIPNPSIIYLTQEEKIVGTAVFCNTQVGAAQHEFNCFYIRYFAAAPEIRGKGLIKKFGAKVMDLVRQGETRKTVFFAAVEKGNRSSYKVVSSVGYQEIGKIKTMGFSRFFPKKSSRIESVQTPEEQQAVLKLLKEHYKEHTLVQFYTLFLHDGYFVIREKGEIVAGAELHTATWVVNNMAGLTGKLIMNLVPRIPLLNQVFNPKRFHFCSFEGIFFKEGHEKDLLELFEGLLAMKKIKSALFWMAEKSPFYQQVSQFGKLGLLNSFVKDSDTFILASLDNMTTEEEAIFKQHPLYVSCYDFI